MRNFSRHQNVIAVVGSIVTLGLVFAVILYVTGARGAPSQEQPKPGEKKSPGSPKCTRFFEAAPDSLTKFANSATEAFKCGAGGTKGPAGEPLFEKRLQYFAYAYDRDFICPQASWPDAEAVPAKLHEHLLALAKEKGARVEKKVIDRPLWAGTKEPTGEGLTSLRNPWKSFAFQYESGKAHGLVQIRLHWQGSGTAPDEKKTPIKAYMLWVTIEEWVSGAGQ